MTDLQGVSGLSLAETQAQIERLKAEAEALMASQKSGLAEAGEDFFNLIVETQTPVLTESTGRFGISVMSLPFTGSDGREYTVSIHVTDVEKTEEGRKAVAAKKAAEKAAAETEKQAQALLQKAETDPALAAVLKKLSG